MSPGQPLDVDGRAQRANARKDGGAGADGRRSDRICRMGAERRHGHDHDLQADMPAEKAGLKEGDQILALDGKPRAGSGGDGREPGSHERQARSTLTVLARVGSRRRLRFSRFFRRSGIASASAAMQTKVKTLPFAAALAACRCTRTGRMRC